MSATSLFLWTSVLSNGHAQPAPSTLVAEQQGGAESSVKAAEYLTIQERAVIMEINLMRTHPAEYAERYLVPMRSYYKGRLLQYPAEIPLVTTEGIAALEECITVLQHTNPLPPLLPRKGLVLAARDHAADQSSTGAIGHKGSDGSSPFERMERYGTWLQIAGENINYGDANARYIVTALLIDDDVPSRGHRKNLLNAQFGVVGVALATHKVYRALCVMDFAGEFE